MKVLDFMCPKCHVILYDVYVKSEEHPRCEKCGIEMDTYWGSGECPGVIGMGDYIPEALRKRQRGRMEDAGIRKVAKPKKGE